MTKEKRKTTRKKPKLHIRVPENLRSHAWKILIITAVAIPLVFTTILWQQANFVTPMPKEVFDRVTEDPIIFSAFAGLVAISLLTQYYLLPTEKRRREIVRKAPILIVIGVGIAVMALALLSWIDPAAPKRTIISTILHRPFVVGAAGGLTIGGIILAFIFSSKETQKTCVKASLTLLAAFLMFGGPTYLIFVLQQLAIPYTLLILFGLASFIAGLILLTYLFKGKEASASV